MLALAIAAGFAALGQWQLGRSIDNATVVDIDTETAVPLDEIAEPASGVTEEQVGRTVSVTGELILDDTVALADRPDGLGGTGTWLVGHVVTARRRLGRGRARLDAGRIAVSAWSDDPRRDWVGRYLPSEEPQASDFENGIRTSVAVSELVNLWAEPGPVYGGFIVLAEPLRRPRPDPRRRPRARGHAQPAERVLRDRVGAVRGLRDLPLVPPGSGCRRKASRSPPK